MPQVPQWHDASVYLETDGLQVHSAVARALRVNSRRRGRVIAQLGLALDGSKRPKNKQMSLHAMQPTSLVSR